MCGFCGELTFDAAPVSTERVARMTQAMRHRGPDSHGLFAQGDVALGHCRLKIIDLSESAQQPMVDPVHGLTIVFNGCIYNHRELRRALEALGHRFFSDHSDTEVILKAYAQWGGKCVERFNGMFAFVIVERDSGRVFAARDRLGIKPFYYTRHGDTLRFASTLPALLEAGDMDRTLDPVALHFYLHWHAVVPAPWTILKNVRKLPAATTLTLERDGRETLHTYWTPRFERDPEMARYSEEDWKHRLLHELNAAITRRMVADVPVGVLLSGGLDSSLLVGMLARNGQKNLNTFSIGFDSHDEHKGDEFEYSDLIASHFDTTHHRISVPGDKALPNLDRCIAAMSEPMVSHDCIGFYLLSEQVSRHVKVVQSGQGADEVFAGYHWYPPLLGKSRDEALDLYTKAFFDSSHEEYLQTVTPDWATDTIARDFVRDHFDQPGTSDALDQALRLDVTVMLVDDPVKRVDNMTMAFGLEARVPFLDHELVEFAGLIPGELKTQPMAQWEKTGGKHILKEAAREVIPAAVIDRPKGYFPVPALKLLRGAYLEKVRDILHDPAARQRGLFRSDKVEELLADPEAHITPLSGSRLWQLALLERWLQIHRIA